MAGARVSRRKLIDISANIGKDSAFIGSGCVRGCLVCAFFFSSRRRHTRFDCDWSSDVCSSDLSGSHGCSSVRSVRTSVRSGRTALCRARCALFNCLPRGHSFHCRVAEEGAEGGERSEERRVGKEGRSRGSPYHLKKKSVVCGVM